MSTASNSSSHAVEDPEKVPFLHYTARFPRLILERFARGDWPRGNNHTPTFETFQGVILQADICGSTRLSEELSRQKPDGLERLAERFGSYLELLVDCVEEYGGDVLRIPGDAVIAFWRLEPDAAESARREISRRVVVCAQKMISRAADRKPLFKVRTSVGCGELAHLLVGGEGERWESLFSGNVMAEIARLHPHSSENEVTLSLDAMTWAGLKEEAKSKQGAVFAIGVEIPVTLNTPPASLSSFVANEDAALEILVQPQSRQVIRTLLQSQDPEKTSVACRVTAVFIKLPGLTLPGSEQLGDIHNAVAIAQSIVDEHGGAIHRIAADDKGMTLVILLGTPNQVHEDISVRAIKMATRLREKLRGKTGLSGIGISTSAALWAIVGSDNRREEIIYGMTMPIASRLMEAAAGYILCDRETRAMAENQFKFTENTAVELKGISEPVLTCSPTDARRGGDFQDAQTHTALIGREPEKQTLNSLLDALRPTAEANAPATLLLLEGEAGLGKSALMAYLLREVRKRNLALLTGATEPTRHALLYGVWRKFLTSLEAPILQFVPEADLELLPLLKAILPADYAHLPETDATRQLLGQVRAENTDQLIIRILQRYASDRPLVLLIEDIHWSDAASLELLHACAQRLRNTLIVLSTRPEPEQNQVDLSHIRALENCRSSRLKGLSEKAIAEIVRKYLGVDALPQDVEDFIVSRAEGNPFFAQQFAGFLLGTGGIDKQNGVCVKTEVFSHSSRRMPNEISRVISTRLDRLDVSLTQVLKAASVLGISFDTRCLQHLLSRADGQKSLPLPLLQLERLGHIQSGGSDGTTLREFRHALIREAAYSLLPHDQKTKLHRAAATWYSERAMEDRGANEAFIADHWKNGEVLNKARDSYARAAAQCLREGAYKEAIALLLETLRLTQDLEDSTSEDVANWHQQLSTAYLNLGELPQSRHHAVVALERIGHRMPSTPHSWRTKAATSLLHHLGRRAGIVKRPPSRNLPSEQIAAQAYARLAHIDYYDLQMARCIYSACSCVNVGEQADCNEELLFGYASLGVLMGFFCRPLVRGYQKSVNQRLKPVVDVSARLFGREVIGLCLSSLGRWDEARDWLKKAYEEASEVKDWRRWEETAEQYIIILIPNVRLFSF